MYIEDAVIESTTKCTKNFGCLKSGDSLCCQVERVITDSVCIIKCSSCSDCSYKVNFGPDCVCQCPTRIEIFDKYNR